MGDTSHAGSDRGEREKLPRKNAFLGPLVRAGMLVASVVALLGVSWFRLGELLPSDPGVGLLVQSSLLLALLGTLVTERFFTSPNDAFVNGVGLFATVWPYREQWPGPAWGILLGYAVTLLLVAFTAITFQAGRAGRVQHPGIVRLQRACYQFCGKFGRARVVFSIVFVAGLLLVDAPGDIKVSLAVVWFVYAFLLSKILQRLSRRVSPHGGPVLGHVLRMQSPALVRARLSYDPAAANKLRPVIVHPPYRKPSWAVPLNAIGSADGIVSTLLLAGEAACAQQPPAGAVVASGTAEIPKSVRTIMDPACGVVGIVCAGSRTDRLRFEVVPLPTSSSQRGTGTWSSPLKVGDVVAVEVGDEREDELLCYYQVIEGETFEEGFDGLRYGGFVATAVPLGLLKSHRFEKFGWLPLTGTPVRRVAHAGGTPLPPADSHRIGTLPGTDMALYCDFTAHLELHTAILGATGSGKSELALSLICAAIADGVRVIVLDVTEHFAARLAELTHSELRPLGTDDGDGSLRQNIDGFLREESAHVGLLDLGGLIGEGAIEQTAACFTSVLEYAKSRGYPRDAFPASEKILLVVDEAQTLVPETGVGKSKEELSRVALQGRKYGVGLLMITQRTALVSKSTLSQCNTVVAFRSADETSIAFMGNIVGRAAAQGLGALPSFHALAYGPWVRSDMPVIFRSEKCARSSTEDREPLSMAM